MAKRRITRRRKRGNRKIKANSTHASLCALVPLIKGRQIFDHIHKEVNIPQKKVDYTPSDKLVFVVIGIMSGCEAVFDLNQNLRKVRQVKLNPLYPLISRIAIAFEALLKLYGIAVSLYEI